MTKKDDSKPVRSRLTVLAFQLEGSDETIQEGLRKISQSVENAFRSQRPTATLGNSAIKTSLQPNESAATVLAEESDEEPASEPAVHEAAEVSSSRSAYKPEKVPDVIEIDRSKAKVSFTDFLAAKKQSDPSSLFLLAAHWLKEQAQIPEFGIDHVFTLLKEEGITSFPKAPRKMLQNMRTRKVLSSGSAEGLYTINTVGMSKVDRMKLEPTA